MRSLQQEIRDYLKKQQADFSDNTESFKDLDFTIFSHGESIFQLEVKEKRKPYNASHWPTEISETDLFILDDLTVRKCINHAPRCGVLVRDSARARYCFFSVVDLAMMPRERVNRSIDNRKKALKGKWLINLNDGLLAGNLEDAFDHIRTYLRNLDEILFERLECYGQYDGETIALAGVTRQPRHWTSDVRDTR
jgi:hypothetical protein